MNAKNGIGLFVKQSVMLGLLLIFVIAILSNSVYAKTSSEWVADGNLHYDAKSYSDALESFNQALEIDANNADAWAGKGNALAQLGQYEEAIAMNPGDAKVWVSVQDGTEHRLALCIKDILLLDNLDVIK